MPTKSMQSTTIRIHQDTKVRIENLDFVRKDTFDQILTKLMDLYENKKEGRR
jgi:hypothetical protein